MTTVTCPAQDICSGCDHLGLPLRDQKSLKIEELSRLLAARSVPFPEIEFLSPGTHALRDRLDFSLQDGRLGLWHRAKREIADLEICPQLSPCLQDWYSDFRRNLPPVRRASIRLRVAPDGRRGLWLDLANVDIKALLDERDWLNSWDQGLWIEMGQRRKFVVRDGVSRPSLVDARLFPWFESRWRDEVVPLYGHVGSFTQPSLAANRWIVDWVQDGVRGMKAKSITEFGAGQGNLSFPALSGEAMLTVCETDRPALAGFEKSLEVMAERGHDLRPRVRIETGDFLRRSSDSLLRADLLIANPPRSGLKSFLDPLTEARELRGVLYMSCHPESFAEDAPRLLAQGFRLAKLRILDQFPQTKHYEVLSNWLRD